MIERMGRSHPLGPPAPGERALELLAKALYRNRTRVGLTDSEMLFRALCRHNRFVAVRLPESRAKGRRRADFLVWRFPFRLLAAEVKQFDPNSEELAVVADRRAGKIVAHGGEPGQRVRAAIAVGAGQLRGTTAGRWPGLLVVCDRTGLDYHDDPYHILTAMFGLETVMIDVASVNERRLRSLGMRFGGKRKVTSSDNRAVSAIGRLYESPARRPCMDVFHNPHTTARLSPRSWGGPTVRHFVLGDPDAEGRRTWNAA
jgi:hypothetical protein